MKKPELAVKPAVVEVEPMYDLEGLMTDFPTAKELEKFIFDRTRYSVDLKGRSNKYKYQVALDILNGATPPPEIINGENPYLDKNELIPVDELKPTPPPPADVIVENIEGDPEALIVVGVPKQPGEPPAPPAPIVIGVDPEVNFIFVPPGKDVL